MRKEHKTRLAIGAALIGITAVAVPAFAKNGVKAATLYPGTCTSADGSVGPDRSTAAARIVANNWTFTHSVSGPDAAAVWHTQSWENDVLLYDMDSDFSDASGGWGIQDGQVVPGAPGTRLITWKSIVTNTATGEVCTATVTVKSKY